MVSKLYRTVCAARTRPRILVAAFVAAVLVPLNASFAQMFVSSGAPQVSACQSCGFQKSYCECIPAWRSYAAAELLWLDRSGGDSQLYIDDPGNLVLGVPNPETDVADLIYNVRAGVRGTLGIEHESGRGIELGYFGVFDQPATYSADGVNLVAVVFNAASLANNVDNITSTLRSDLHSGEINWLMRNRSRVRPILGVRWLRLGEEWDVFETAAPTIGTFAEITNDMIGGQVGLDTRLWETSNRLYIDARMMGVILNNDVDLAAFRQDTTPAFSAFNSQESSVGYAGQLDITARWQPTRNFSVLLGYSGLWLINVAQVTDQTDDFNITTGAGTFDFQTVVYQGGRIGVELTW